MTNKEIKDLIEKEVITPEDIEDLAYEILLQEIIVTNLRRIKKVLGLKMEAAIALKMLKEIDLS